MLGEYRVAVCWPQKGLDSFAESTLKNDIHTASRYNPEIVAGTLLSLGRDRQRFAARDAIDVGFERSLRVPRGRRDRQRFAECDAIDVRIARSRSVPPAA